jgi:hypothetical protein
VWRWNAALVRSMGLEAVANEGMAEGGLFLLGNVVGLVSLGAGADFLGLGLVFLVGAAAELVKADAAA